MNFEIRIGDPDDDGVRADGSGSVVQIIALLRQLAAILEEKNKDDS